ncbi:olfactory receptor 7C1-like [Stegastes partitus]|uniref:Olfactory receptor 7C1-like n=1 Tax=Stegastes partitus TaxID=144197 RepID=A0A9Y4K964_9TELE|nr:PREDICTED: olfactory receptor 7C1-like [Stegastes partitus]
MILWGNLALVVAVIVDKNLHEPMYIILCNLCLNALYGTVGFYPKFLIDLFSSHVISYAGCMLQGFVIHSSVCCDFSILALMSYDRYVAICRPLVYHSVMTKQRISIYVFFSWLIPLNCMFMNTATVLGSRLVKLCSSHIARLFCVNWSIVQLACFPAETAINGIVTKEMVVDFRSGQGEHAPLTSDGSTVEIVQSTRFLGVHLAESLTWSLNPSSIAKKAQLLLAEAERSPPPTLHTDNILQRDY